MTSDAGNRHLLAQIDGLTVSVNSWLDTQIELNQSDKPGIGYLFLQFTLISFTGLVQALRSRQDVLTANDVEQARNNIVSYFDALAHALELPEQIRPWDLIDADPSDELNPIDRLFHLLVVLKNSAPHPAKEPDKVPSESPSQVVTNESLEGIPSKFRFGPIIGSATSIARALSGSSKSAAKFLWNRHGSQVFVIDLGKRKVEVHFYVESQYQKVMDAMKQRE
ncbi:MAG: hypothetical protein JNL58_28195 [Planctomyces sp.]|nr:hypothetical protein [Planctomyces sp.]